MDDPLRSALTSVGRAKSVLRLLVQSRKDSDINQAIGGLGTELTIIESAIRQALGAAILDAVGDRPGKVANGATAQSRAAATRVTVKSGTQRGRILLAIHNAGGLDDHELVNATDIKPDTVRPRRGELVDAGLVMPSPAEKTHGGTRWAVWTCTPLGHETARELIRLGIRGSVTIDPNQCVEPNLDEQPVESTEDDPVLF